MQKRKKTQTSKPGVNPCPRKSVGIVVLNAQDEMLCLYRKSYPPGLACPAGHLDFVGVNKVLESPCEAAIRELREETGLEVSEGFGAPLLHETFSNPCKAGYDSHEWWVYGVRIKGVLGEMCPTEPEKHAFLKFLSPREIIKYIARDDCDPAWQKYIWPALFAFHAPYFHVVSQIQNLVKNI